MLHVAEPLQDVSVTLLPGMRRWRSSVLGRCRKVCGLWSLCGGLSSKGDPCGWGQGSDRASPMRWLWDMRAGLSSRCNPFNRARRLEGSPLRQDRPFGTEAAVARSEDSNEGSGEGDEPANGTLSQAGGKEV